MAAELRTSCPHCGRETDLDPSQFGSAVRCRTCFRTFSFEQIRFGDASPPRSRSSSAIAAVDETRGAIGALGTIGRFVLKERVGEGSFGVVFRAFDPVLDREVALKVPRLALGDARTTRRFLAEAKAAARLRHPGIVAVYEAGFADGVPYLASEFVRGQTLSERIARTRPSLGHAVGWVEELARALAYAHAEGVIHRDVKPGNIMLDAAERPQLMDFGLARALDAESSLTAEGSVLGTPAYMSPEQARGDTKAIGPKSDQYSLGAILFELLSGEKPFSGPPHAVLAQVASSDDAPLLRGRAPTVPKDLESICRRAMEKDPARRYETTAAFADDLTRWRQGLETQARPLSILERGRRAIQRRPAVAGLSAATLLTALVGFALVFHQWRSAEESRSDLLAEQARSASLLRQALRERDLARSAAEEAALQRARAEREEATARRKTQELREALDESQRHLAEARRERARADEAGALAERLSHDVVAEQTEGARHEAQARRIAARRDADLGQRFAEAGQPAVATLHLARGLQRLPPESSDLEWHLRMNLALARRDVHEAVRMLHVGGDLRSIDVHSTGLLIATGDEAGVVKLHDAEEGLLMLELPAAASAVRCVRFSPDGKQLLAIAGESNAQLWPVAKDLQEPMRFPHPDVVTSGAFDARGRKLATGCEDRQARVWNVAGTRLAVPAMEHDAIVSAVALDPAGALLLTGTAGLTHRVTLWDAESGRRLGVLHDGRADVEAVTFSLDGQIAAAGLADGTVRLWRIRDRVPLRGPPTLDGPAIGLAFDSAGRLFVAARNGWAGLWDPIAARQIGQRIRHEDGVTAIACGPSGELATAGADGAVRVARSAGSHEGAVPHEERVTRIAVAPDGTRLALGDVMGAVRLFDIAQGTTIGEPLHLGGSVTALAFSEDGRTVACAAEDGTCRQLDVGRRTLGPRLRHEGPVDFAAFLPGMESLVTVERNGPLRIWDLDTNRQKGPAFIVEGGVTAVAIARNGSRIAAGGNETAGIWNVTEKVTESSKLAVGGRIADLAFSEEAGKLLVGTESGEVTSWDVATGQPAGPTFTHGAGLHTVQFGPDDRLAVTAGGQPGLRLWDVATGKPYGSALAEQSGVASASFRSDGRFLITGSKNGEVALWDAVLGRRVGRPFQLGDAVAELAASRDDGVLVALGEQGRVQLWTMPPPLTMDAAAASVWAEAATGMRLDEAEETAILSPGEWSERLDKLVKHPDAEILPREPAAGATAARRDTAREASE